MLTGECHAGKSEVGEYWNILLRALDGDSPWVRYTSTDPKLSDELEEAESDSDQPNGSFTQGIGIDKAAGAGAMFYAMPGAMPGGPTHMINANSGSAFYLGNYDEGAEVMTVTSSLQYNVIDSAGW